MDPGEERYQLSKAKHYPSDQVMALEQAAQVTAWGILCTITVRHGHHEVNSRMGFVDASHGAGNKSVSPPELASSLSREVGYSTNMSFSLKSSTGELHKKNIINSTN